MCKIKLARELLIDFVDILLVRYKIDIHICEKNVFPIKSMGDNQTNFKQYNFYDSTFHRLACVNVWGQSSQ